MGARDSTDDRLSARLRELPSVQWLALALAAEDDADRPGAQDEPGPMLVAAARDAIAHRRAELHADLDAAPADLVARARASLRAARRPSPRPVINATGVIVHTNLGRAPLAASAREAVARIAEGYSNLELDLERGRRGSRHEHVASVLTELTGAEAALVVNNCAAAALLGAAALAGPGRSIVVSRGELIEIGGSFRVPDVIAASGSRLVEVGTTNRTRLEDYVRALEAEGERAGAVLRVHQSNFRAVGFVEAVAIEQLCELGVAVIDDVGSGVLGLVDETERKGSARAGGPLASGLAALRDEPSARRSVRAGAALVCFSGDKLLGGPQAGLIVGSAGAVMRARTHPLARAMRIDKLSLAALQATLALYRDPGRARSEIPVLAMLDADPEQLRGRARRLAAALASGQAACAIVEAVAKVGGGALPLLELSGPAVAVEGGSGGVDALAAALRAGDPAVVARIAEGRLLLDPRTMTDAEADAAAAAVETALGGAGAAGGEAGDAPRGA